MRRLNRHRILATSIVFVAVVSIVMISPVSAGQWVGEQSRYVASPQPWMSYDFGWGKISVNTWKVYGNVYKYQVTFQWEIWLSHPYPMVRELAGIDHMSLVIHYIDGGGRHEIEYIRIYNFGYPAAYSQMQQVRIWYQTPLLGWQWCYWDVWYGSYTSTPRIGITGVQFNAYMEWLHYDQTSWGQAQWRMWNYAGTYQGWQSGNYLPVIGSSGASTGLIFQYFPDVYFTCPGYT